MIFKEMVFKEMILNGRRDEPRRYGKTGGTSRAATARFPL
jgi:hypothetical protein